MRLVKYVPYDKNFYNVYYVTSKSYSMERIYKIWDRLDDMNLRFEMSNVRDIFKHGKIL